MSEPTPRPSMLVTSPQKLSAVLERRAGARNHKLGELLVAAGVTTEVAVAAALTAQAAGNKARLGDILVAMGATTPDGINLALDHHYGMPWVDIARYPINKDALKRVRDATIHQLGVLPFELLNNVLYIATAQELPPDALRILKFASGCAQIVCFRPQPKELLRKLIQRYYPRTEDVQLGVVGEHRGGQHPSAQAADGPFRQILAQAIASGASDVHIRPSPDGRRDVFLRVDGVLTKMLELSEAVALALTRQLEAVSGMSLRKKHEAGEGRLSVDCGGVAIDVRISIMPSASGSSVVLRLLDPRRFPASIEHLQLVPKQQHALSALVTRPHGLFLVTGPTGSGKTTTLYTLLTQLHTERQLHIATAEDPVEYRLKGINQFNTSDFAGTLKLLLRHDPDVIMVGELRDADAGLMAVNAAMTGHLVLSTIHANDSVGAVHRMLGLGVPPVLIGASLTGVMSQRLVKLRCQVCQGTGCENCHQTGYAGRRLVAEMIHPRRSFADELRPTSSYADICQHIEYVGGVCLDDALVTMAERGETDWKEVTSLIANRSRIPEAMNLD